MNLSEIARRITALSDIATSKLDSMTKQVAMMVLEQQNTNKRLTNLEGMVGAYREAQIDLDRQVDSRIKKVLSTLPCYKYRQNENGIKCAVGEE
jgi:hypothetical protein